MPFIPPFWTPSQASAVIFDWDGIIAQTNLDFSEIRERYYGNKRAMLLEDSVHLAPDVRGSFFRDLEELETAGAQSAEPVDGIREVLFWLAERNVPWAVVSRNCRKSIEIASSRIGISLPRVVRSRDDGDPLKPHPGALTQSACALGADAAHTLFVGDFIYDMMCARRAGMRGALVRRNIGETWRPWLECSYPDMSGLLEDLRSPREIVPWEYRETARDLGTQFLRFAAGLTLAVPEQPAPSLDRWLAEAARIGVGCLSVPSGTLSPDAWKASPSLDPAYMGLTLEEAARVFLEVRFPFVKVASESPDAISAPSDAASLPDFILSFRGQAHP